jgi:hypothetical protein
LTTVRSFMVVQKSWDCSVRLQGKASTWAAMLQVRPSTLVANSTAAISFQLVELQELGCKEDCRFLRLLAELDTLRKL